MSDVDGNWLTAEASPPSAARDGFVLPLLALTEQCGRRLLVEVGQGAADGVQYAHPGPTTGQVTDRHASAARGIDLSMASAQPP